jgi:biopolymer transport protein ExbD
MVTRAPTAQSNAIVEMNITPLIDVMLVLLVMFIITIPIQTHAVKLDLPTSQPTPIIHAIQNEIQITPAGTLLWNGKAVTKDQLRTALRASQQLPNVPELHLRPDAQAKYEMVDDVLVVIKRERVQKVGFVGNEAYALR